MIIQHYKPGPPLEQYVHEIFYIEGNTKGTGLPKIAMSLVFNLEDSFKLFTDSGFNQYVDYKRHWVAGLQTCPRSVESYGSSKMLVVQFKVLGAFMLLNDPLHYYTNRYVPLDDVFRQAADDTWEQLKEATDREEQFLILEHFLCKRLLANRSPNQKLLHATQSLIAQHGMASITKTCAALDISRKHLNELSKTFIGVSPKTIASLKRLQLTLKTISQAPAEKLSNVAYELEYFDQAHFINDFRRYTGLRPAEYAGIVRQRPSVRIVPHFIPF